MPDRLELHRARVQKGIDLAHISASTCLNTTIVVRIDEGRFEELPAGVYARSYVRTFAKAIGIPPDEAVGWVQEYLRASEDPIPALLERTPKSSFDGLWAFLGSQVSHYPAVATLLADAHRRRAAAAVVDALLLTLIGFAMVAGTAWITALEMQRLLHVAGVELALMFSVPVALYFMLLEGLQVPTVGKVLCGANRTSPFGRGVRIRHRVYGRHKRSHLTRAPARRDAGHHDRGAEHLALHSAPARR